MGRINKTPWTDKTIMPWGQYKGESMENVPADYLDWLRQQDWLPKWPGLDAYIKANKDVIDQQLAEDEASRGSIDGGDEFEGYEDYRRFNS
jgi:hypothetical protein